MKSMLFVAVVFVVFNAIQFGECNEGGLRRCRQNEEYVHCVKRCNTCVYQEDCWEDGRCISGCDCKHGYFKNRHGKCVLERDCGCKCKKDEQYYRNMPDCKNTCENYDNPGVRCKPGKSGCFCREGLVKRKDGRCVRPEECFTEKCGPNEEYSKCVNPCNNCQTRGNCQFLVCNKGCDCKPGFRRDEYGRCIPESQCPPGKCTKKGEVYKSCGSPCEATCSTIYQRTLMRCPTVCKAGCFCRDGLVRDSNRNCVKPCECEKHPECGKNEQYYECIPSCKGYCETYNKNIACKIPCKPGCFCKKGFVKRKDGKCVRPKDCFRSGHSHDWKKEKGSTEERSFDDDEDIDEGGHEGYSVQKQEEETSGREDREERAFDQNDEEEVEDGNESEGNEGFKKGRRCPQIKCAKGCYLDRHHKPCPKCVCKPKPGCPQLFCRKGCYLDRHHKPCPRCVCKPDHECGKNEQYYECIPSCKGYCETYNKNIACKMPCKPGCFCKKGFVKRKDGKCVRPKDCFRSGHSHDWKREKGSDEERSFDDDEDSYEGGHKGYSDQKEYEETSRHEDREERAFNQNDEEEVEDGNESEGNGGFKKGRRCPQIKCAKGCYLDRHHKPCPKCVCKPKPGCPQLFCRKGCYLDRHHKPCPRCVCKPVKCHADEVYQKCGSPCPDTCENYGKPHACEPICIPGCFCKKGLVRSKDGRCITPENCGKEKCNDDEEFLTCGSSCPDTCDNYGKPRICTLQCVRGCFCKRGLVRNNQLSCVIPERCRKTEKQCNKDEIYIQCGTACPETCDNYGQPRPCPLICVPGCFCRKGLIRNVDTKRCVRPRNCWKTHIRQDSKVTGVEGSGDDDEGSDREESYESEEGISENDNFELESETEHDSREQRYLIDDDEGSGDDKSPKGHGGKPGPGPICFIPKCDVGCTIDHSTKPCPTCRCHDKPKCKRHEQYYDCIPSCRGTCETYNKPILCSQLCVPGCYCKKGRVKRKDGKCVKPKDCPNEPTPCGKDEIYVECVPCGNTCETYPQRKYCKPICKPGCTCKDGLVKRKDGKCVPPRKCKEISDCGKNEEIVDCVKPKWCNTCEIKGNCKLSYCTRGCDCKRGYYRNAKGICIPEYQCRRCKRDEEYYQCIPDCYNRCVPKTVCPKICRPGCFCRKGLVLREDGKCVKRKHCNVHVPCKKDEQYYECTPSCKNTCRNYNNPAVRCACGPPGCFCREGLVQTDDGRCVKPEDCPGKEPHCGPDEEYYQCKPFCTNKCNPIKICPKICISGCFCRKGLVLRDDGKCVRKCQCNDKPPDDKKCKKDEQYYECIPFCRNTCEAYGRDDVICPTICKAGCFCRKGLVKRKDGKCVKPEHCKPCPKYSCRPGCYLDKRIKPCPKCVCKKGSTKHSKGSHYDTEGEATTDYGSEETDESGYATYNEDGGEYVEDDNSSEDLSYSEEGGGYSDHETEFSVDESEDEIGSEYTEEETKQSA